MMLAPRPRHWLVPAFALLALSMATPASAESVENLAKELKGNEDFRVRTQAALSLGKSNQVDAVAPLCEALASDGSDAVRGAAAAALGKLGKKEALSACLEARKDAESSASVKSQIEKSIALLNKSATKIPPGAKYYVSIGKVNNKTQRSEVDSLVREAAAKKLTSMDGYAVAPKGEVSAAAKKVIDEKSLKGFQLLTTIDPPSYDGDKLTVVVKVTVTTYPGSSILAGFTPKLTQTGVSGADKSSEDELMKMAVERALESLEKVASSL